MLPICSQAETYAPHLTELDLLLPRVGEWALLGDATARAAALPSSGGRGSAGGIWGLLRPFGRPDSPARPRQPEFVVLFRQIPLGRFPLYSLLS